MKDLELRGTDRAVCPSCGKACHIRSHHIDKSGLWTHYFGKKCREVRGKSPEVFPNGEELTTLIKKARTKGRKLEKDYLKSQEMAEITRNHEDHKQRDRKHLLSGGFLLDVISELDAALNMMEPYYSQCHADSSGREMVRTLEAIVEGLPKETLD